MSNDQRRATRQISMVALLGALLLAPLYGCRTVGSSWEEDRSIPFSADDRAIAYQHKGAVYVARTQGDKHRQIFESAPESIVSTPHWAPGQRGVVFAVASHARDSETGLVEYELWYWPAPEDIWTSEADGPSDDSAELPERWRPEDPRKLLSAHCRDEMQVRANALFSWHPDGSHILFLDTGDSRLQTVWSYNMNTGAREAAAPISAASLAFSIAPRGSRLQLAAADKRPSALWVGPMGADAGAWQRIESRPGTRSIPKMAVADGGADSEPSLLYDLRPRLGAWSPDAQWLAHTRAPTEDVGRFELVLTPLTTDEPPRVVVMPGSYTQDLHWRSGGQELAVLSDQKLLVVDPYGDAVTNLSGTLPVEGFMGWSAPGNHMAYLILAEDFETTSALLPTEHIVEWQSAQRHNLMMAKADGSAPQSQFGLMNISAARWSNQSAKLSFWATHLPTVSLLPPGDPAAVLDLEQDKISWYPTDIAEYGHVGHYYLLNAQFEKAAEHYGDALRKISDGDREELPLLESQLRRWRGIARLASGDESGARQDLSFAREHTAAAGSEDTPAAEDATSWDKDVLRDLVADRNVLSTMLSMGQVQLMVAEAGRIIEDHDDARRIQALCYLALVYASIGRHEAFTDQVVRSLIPEAMESEQVPRGSADRLVRHYVNAVLDPANLRALSAESKRQFGDLLAQQSAAMITSNPQRSATLKKSAVAFYREAGATDAEAELLAAVADRSDTNR